MPKQSLYKQQYMAGSILHRRGFLRHQAPPPLLWMVDVGADVACLKAASRLPQDWL